MTGKVNIDSFGINVIHRDVILERYEVDFRSLSHDFFRCAFGTSKLARAFSARFVRFVSGIFALFNFLSCLYIVPLPKILASRLVVSLGMKLRDRNLARTEETKAIIKVYVVWDFVKTLIVSGNAKFHLSLYPVTPL